MPLELTRGGIGGEFLMVDDDNPHDGKGPKYVVFRIGNDGRKSVWDADVGFDSQDKDVQSSVDLYFELKNLTELQELDEMRKYEMMATNDYDRKMRYIIEDD
jgi:hypothetical protein